MEDWTGSWISAPTESILTGLEWTRKGGEIWSNRINLCFLRSEDKNEKDRHGRRDLEQLEKTGQVDLESGDS